MVFDLDKGKINFVEFLFLFVFKKSKKTSPPPDADLKNIKQIVV